MRVVTILAIALLAAAPAVGQSVGQSAAPSPAAAFVARTLAASIVRSRDSARAEARPIPEDIRAALSPYYREETLDAVRFTIGDTDPAGLAGFAIRNGDAAAVTLIDTVVFSSEDYARNVALWAHELHHVEQYGAWGVEEFARRYVLSWDAVEAEARARARDFVAWYRERHGL